MGKIRELIYCQECGSKLKKVEADGRERMKCSACNKIAYENPVPATAAVVFNNRGELLLVKRNVEPKNGEWCLPGGFTEVGETPEECCIRELEEETGLRGKIERIILSVPGINPFYRSVIVTGFSIKEYSGDLKAGDDSDDSKFFKLSEMPPVAFKSHREILNSYMKNERYEIDRSKLKNMGAYVITSDDHIKIAEEACRGGARIIQYRDKKSTQAEKLNIAKAIRDITKKKGTLFIVNDNIDVALLSGADGVHLGQDDISVEEARKIVPGNFIVGKSTHSLPQALTAENDDADYIGIGPVHQTPTKEDYFPIGVDTVKEVIKKIEIPFVCIGGLDMDNVQEL
ncbi:MAG: thiamine phosphate synthase, partial [Acidobacteriota bacterium]